MAVQLQNNLAAGEPRVSNSRSVASDFKNLDRPRARAHLFVTLGNVQDLQFEEQMKLGRRTIDHSVLFSIIYTDSYNSIVHL